MPEGRGYYTAPAGKYNSRRDSVLVAEVADLKAADLAAQLVILHLRNVRIVTGGADDLFPAIDRQYLRDFGCPFGVHRHGVLDVGRVGRGVVTAEAEQVRIGEKFHRLDGVPAGNRPFGMAELAALPLVYVKVGITVPV